MRRAIVILLVLALLVLAGFAIYRNINQNKTIAPDYETLRVEKGNLLSTVSATGTIEPEGQVSLIFRGAGKVAEVAVKEGDTVTVGQVLARLETDDLDLALSQAETSLEISRAQLARLKTPAEAEDLAAAEASVASAEANVTSAEAALASAQASYADLQAGPSDDEKQAAASALERARVARDQAQSAYDQIANQPNVGLMPQSLQLQQATIEYNTATANYRVATAAPSAAQLAAARAQIAQSRAALEQAKAGVAQAQSSLAKLQRGAGAQDVLIAEAQIRQAELSLQQSQLTRDNSALITPIDGVVTELNITAGELPNSALPGVVVTDLSRFHINITVDEIDIGRLAVGQPVQVTLDALPEAQIVGHIEHIANTPTSGSGTVSYRITVVIDEADAALRSGLSATASITTQELKDIVLIPNRSIQVDRTTGRAYVEKIVNGVPTQTEVQLGARNDQSSQVLSGLEAGDTLAIRSGSSLERLRSSMFGG
ncbi:MAG: efflux RND transporter periplasmic adaptor subunit [Caldilineales bacterium]